MNLPKRSAAKRHCSRSLSRFKEALARGLGDQDTASVCEVLKKTIVKRWKIWCFRHRHGTGVRIEVGTSAGIIESVVRPKNLDIMPNSREHRFPDTAVFV